MIYSINAKKCAQLSFALALIPSLVVLVTLAIPRVSGSSIGVAHISYLIVSIWIWVWAPTYFLAKGLFLWDCRCKRRSEIKQAAPWMIAVNLAIIIMIVSTAMLQQYSK